MLLKEKKTYTFSGFLDFANDARFFREAVSMLQHQTYYFTKLNPSLPRDKIEKMVKDRSAEISKILESKGDGATWDFEWIENTVLYMGDFFTVKALRAFKFQIVEYAPLKKSAEYDDFNRCAD